MIPVTPRIGLSFHKRTIISRAQMETMPSSPIIYSAYESTAEAMRRTLIDKYARIETDPVSKHAVIQCDVRVLTEDEYDELVMRAYSAGYEDAQRWIR